MQHREVHQMLTVSSSPTPRSYSKSWRSPMARYNEILTGRYNRLLQKLLQMKGGPPAPQLASEISPQLSIPDLGVESRFHLGWNSFAFPINTPPGASTPPPPHFRKPT